MIPCLQSSGHAVVGLKQWFQSDWLKLTKDKRMSFKKYLVKAHEGENFLVLLLETDHAKKQHFIVLL